MIITLDGFSDKIFPRRDSNRGPKARLNVALDRAATTAGKCCKTATTNLVNGEFDERDDPVYQGWNLRQKLSTF